MKRTAPVVIRSASFERKLKTIRRLADQTKGQVEIALEIGGAVRGHAVYAIDCLIPSARVRSAYFKVDDRDLSECWANAENNPETRHLSPVGDLHFHPGLGRPIPSDVDRDNSTRQAALYHVFNLKEFLQRKIIEPRLENDRCLYDLDDWHRIIISGAGACKTAQVCLEEACKHSLWASLIYPANARPKRVNAAVVEHIYQGDDPDSVVHRHLNVTTRVMRDKAIAQILDWPLDWVHLPIDETSLHAEIDEKYQSEDEYIAPTASSVSIVRGCTHAFPVLIRSNSDFLNGMMTHTPFPVNGYADVNRRFLTGTSTKTDIASLLRKTAGWIEGSISVDLNDGRVNGGTADALNALTECVSLLKWMDRA